MKLTLTLLVVVLSQTSCSYLLKPEPIVVTKTVYLNKRLPDNLLSDCNIPQPPDKDFYMKAKPKQRELILTEYIEDLMLRISECGKHFKSIRSWRNNVLDIEL